MTTKKKQTLAKRLEATRVAAEKQVAEDRPEEWFEARRLDLRRVIEDAARGRASQAGSALGKQKVEARKRKMTAALVAALKELGFDHPTQYFGSDGAFRYGLACTRCLGALPAKVQKLLAEGRPGHHPDDLESLTLDTLHDYTNEVRHWTRADRDQEYWTHQAADETLDPAVRDHAAEMAKRIPTRP